MEISCEEVIRELSDFIEKRIDSDLSAKIAEHLASCRHCTAVYDGTRNVIRLVGDDRVFELPAGFSERLRNRLAREAPRR